MNRRDVSFAHEQAMSAVGFASQLLDGHLPALERLITAEASAHSHLHITYPALYRDLLFSDGVRQQVEMARAAVAFLAVMDRVKSEIIEKA